MARPIKVLVTTDTVVSELQRRAKAPTSAYRDRFRAEIILLRLSGLKVVEVAPRLGTSVPTVSLWSNRFGKSGIAGLNDKAGRGRKPSIPRIIAVILAPFNEGLHVPSPISCWDGLPLR